MKGYIIMQKGYEYDDNIYNQTEGGRPTRIFFRKEDAEFQQEELEIQAMKQNDISYYTYELGDQLLVDINKFREFVSKLNDEYGKPSPKYRYGEFRLNPAASKEESLEYLKMHSVRFYEVVECDVDVPSMRDYKIDEALS
jgi:hypothetical protein